MLMLDLSYLLTLCKLITNSQKHTKNHFFDCMASTHLDPDVLCFLVETMKDSLSHISPSPQYPLGNKALQDLNNAEHTLIKCLNAPKTSQIVWTSGATESINLALQGTAKAYKHQRTHIITTALEHSATASTVRQLAKQGFDVEYLPCSSGGLVSLESLRRALRPNTLMVSIHHVHNELGIVQDIKTICDLTASHGVLSHLDCAQSIGKVKLDLSKLRADFVSLSAHKCHGPKGIGALYRRQNPKRQLVPILFGGGQQYSLRPGTPNTALISAMAMAVRLAVEKQNPRTEHLLELRTRFLQSLPPSVLVNSPLEHSVPHCINISLPMSVSVETVKELKAHFCISSFSACNHQAISDSLTAIGLANPLHLRTLRIGLTHTHTVSDVLELAEAINRCVRGA